MLTCRRIIYPSGTPSHHASFYTAHLCFLIPFPDFAYLTAAVHDQTSAHAMQSFSAPLARSDTCVGAVG